MVHTLEQTRKMVALLELSNVTYENIKTSVPPFIVMKRVLEKNSFG